MPRFFRLQSIWIAGKDCGTRYCAHFPADAGCAFVLPVFVRAASVVSSLQLFATDLAGVDGLKSRGTLARTITIYL